MDNEQRTPDISQTEKFDELANVDFKHLFAKYATVLSFEKE